MDYLSLLLQNDKHKKAIITDTESYSYQELYDAALQLRNSAEKNAQVIFIHEDTILRQLINFLAYSGTETVPVIATAVSKAQDFSATEVPSGACMGVMTSGSTGKSKLLWRSFASWYDFFPEQNKIFGVNDETVIFCQGSLAFTGNLNIYLSVLFAGGTLVVTEKFLPRHWLQLIKEHKVNTLYLIPSKLLLLPKCFSGINKMIKSIISGSQSMGLKEAEKLKKIFPQTEICLYYGASELNYISYIKDSEMTDDKTNIGRPFQGVDVFIDNEEIFVTTAYGVEGISQPFSLKDKGYLDEAGCLHFLGRTDDIYNVNGLKISSQKVEQALMDISQVNEAAVVLHHENDADYLIAFIGSDQQLKKHELVQALKQNLADHELPRQFYCLPSLPKNESSKIDKLKLLELLK